MKVILKRCFLALGIVSLIFSYNPIFAGNPDTSTNITPFSWSTISNIEDIILQNENSKKLTKRSLDQTKIGNQHYMLGVASMNNKDYKTAISEFKNAMKRYKRAKLNDNSLNYVITNMALAYACNTNDKKSKLLAERFLKLLTKKIYKEPEWAYNIAMVYYMIGNSNQAAELLSSCIKMNNFDFQSYVTLEEIYRESGNIKDANKVTERMNDAEIKLAKNKLKPNKKQKTKKQKTNIKFIPEGEKPDISSLKIVRKIDHLQYNNTNKISDRSMADINEGISFYDDGVNALNNKEYISAQEKLKNAEKQLKRGKVVDDGLNFTRANLVIAYLNSDERRGASQAKRYLRYLTPKLYSTREWTYNMAVANYNYSQKTKGAQKTIYTKEAIRLFELTIRKDKLFLPAYENLIYVYKELGETKKAEKTYKNYEKSRNELMKSFSKQEQKSFGLEDPYIFRINLGTFSEFDTPIEIFEESYLISVPLNNNETSYLSGMFYTLDEAIEYQKKMKKKGFDFSFIVAFKNGEKLEF